MRHGANRRRILTLGHGVVQVYRMPNEAEFTARATVTARPSDRPADGFTNVKA